MHRTQLFQLTLTMDACSCRAVDYTMEKQTKFAANE
jgi:hypothetical protein